MQEKMLREILKQKEEKKRYECECGLGVKKRECVYLCLCE